MDIINATKTAMDLGVGITKPELKQVGFYLLPTNTDECYFFMPEAYTIKDERKPAPRWNPHAADILANDWEVIIGEENKDEWLHKIMSEIHDGVCVSSRKMGFKLIEKNGEIYSVFPGACGHGSEVAKAIKSVNDWEPARLSEYEEKILNLSIEHWEKQIGSETN